MLVLAAKNTPTTRTLARELGIRKYHPGGIVFPGDGFVLNWGWPGPIHRLQPGAAIINRPEAVANASDKVLTFSILEKAEIQAVPHTYKLEEALAWHENNKTVYARTLTRAFGGRGIVLIRPDDPMDPDLFRNVKLFTRFVKCDYEARAHVAGGRVIDYAIKKRRKVEEPPANRYWIRNYANGWVFTRNGVVLPREVGEVAIAAVTALRLDFGAVDLRVRGDRVYVLEVNSAPRLVGTTLGKYLNYFSLFK